MQHKRNHSKTCYYLLFKRLEKNFQIHKMNTKR